MAINCTKQTSALTLAHAHVESYHPSHVATHTHTHIYAVEWDIQAKTQSQAINVCNNTRKIKHHIDKHNYVYHRMKIPRNVSFVDLRIGFYSIFFYFSFFFFFSFVEHKSDVIDIEIEIEHKQTRKHWALDTSMCARWLSHSFSFASCFPYFVFFPPFLCENNLLFYVLQHTHANTKSCSIFHLNSLKMGHPVVPFCLPIEKSLYDNLPSCHCSI